MVRMLHSATKTSTAPDYATPPILTFAIDSAGTKTRRQHTQIYIMTSFASIEPTRTTITPSAKSRKHNRLSLELSQTIDRPPATPTHPLLQTSSAPYITFSSSDTIAAVAVYPKESTVSTTRSTAPTSPTCNQVTNMQISLLLPRQDLQRKYISSIISNAFSVSLPLAGLNRVSSETTTSDLTKQTSFSRNTSADTRFRHPTSNGRSRLSATFRQCYSMSPPQSTAKTFSAQTSGHTPSRTGCVCTPPLRTQSSKIRPLASTTPTSSSTHTTSIDSNSETCSASPSRNMNASGNSTTRMTVKFYVGD